ncbi:MAG: cell wall hydrolase, partial [Oscillospiraceae bacterium]|nr:cell wall hydrolase [Oscillospiraceae bacterium]
MAVVLIISALTSTAMAGFDLAAADDRNDKKEHVKEELFVMMPVINQRTGGEYIPEDSLAEIEIIVDGVEADTEYLAFLNNGTTYAPVRSVCMALGATEVAFDGKAGEVRVSAEGLEMVIPLDKPYLIANGRYIYVPDGFLLKEDKLMAPVRALCTAFGASIAWDAEDAAVIITSGEDGPILPGELFYSQDDVYWLSRIINAEAGNEPFLGKIAVGNVIMNRVFSSEFPDTVYDVIFDRKCGVQFTPTVNGSIYMTPDN